MSEFKFACPVCGQHITTDSSTSGSHVECPTCFRKMVVPQPPEGETKLLLSASEVGVARSVPHLPVIRHKPRWRAWLDRTWSVVSVLLLAAAAGGALYWYQGRIRQTLPASQPASNRVAEPTPPAVYAQWSLDPTQAAFPHRTVSGTIQDRPFAATRAVLRGSTLSLRQGAGWPPEIGISIVLLQEPGPGEIVTALPGAQAPAPRIIVRWKEDRGQHQRHTHRGGYLLKLTMDKAEAGRRQGRIYLALPDTAHSYVAGEFTAEVLPPWTRPPEENLPE